MSATSEARVAERQVLIVGPYRVLGTGVVNAVAENPRCGITTAARRPAPTYRLQAWAVQWPSKGNRATAHRADLPPPTIRHSGEMDRKERSQVNRLASSSGQGTEPKHANELGYESLDLRCDEPGTLIALTLPW